MPMTDQLMKLVLFMSGYFDRASTKSRSRPSTLTEYVGVLMDGFVVRTGDSNILLENAIP